MTFWESIQKNMTWRGVFIASFAAGTAYLLTWLVLSLPVLEVDPTLILKYFASLVLGSGIIDDGGTAVILVGGLIHYVLSFVFAFLIAIVIHRWGFWVGLIGGGLLGVAIYGINLYTMTVFFEWFFALETNLLLLCHIVFGAISGGVYELFDHYDEPLILDVSDETA